MRQFQNIRLKKPQSSVFDLSHEKKLTLNMGELVPIFLSDVIPGDRFSVNMEAMVRFQPLLSPIMHRINVYTHFFFVPNRIIWEEWEDFITGGKEGNLEPAFPVLTSSTGSPVNSHTKSNYLSVGQLPDYMGVPVGNIAGSDVVGPISQLPFRAYQEIYNQYYRDQNLIDEISNPRSSGVMSYNDAAGRILMTLRKRAWEKDYFTSALPWAQRGDTVKIPIAGEANVSGNPEIFDDQGDPYAGADLGSSAQGKLWDKATQDLVGMRDLNVNLEDATSTDITDLRKAYAVQRWLEKGARGGARYVEQLLHRFGVKSPDARLQRPEYLGGGKMPVQISEVLQTSATEAGSAQGNLSGHGITAGRTTGFKKRFLEHGQIMGIMSILPRTAYQQGLPRSFKKFDRFDYFFPEFANIGEQEVKRREIYLQNSEADEETFGYQERYAEYRTMNDSVHGELRDSLDFWHLGRKFTSAPPLNASFVEYSDDNRIYPVMDPEFKKVIVQSYAKCTARRPIPKFGDPK